MRNGNGSSPAVNLRAAGVLALLLLASALPAWGAPEAAAAVAPLSADPLGATDEEPRAVPEADLLPCLFLLLERSRYGASDREAAAWLVRSESGAPLGEAACLPWPEPAVTGVAVWKGPVPRGAVAQLHTHPTRTTKGRSWGSQPSVQDCQTARRLGVPVVVVTASEVNLCTADRGVVVRLLGPGWVAREAPTLQASAP